MGLQLVFYLLAAYGSIQLSVNILRYIGGRWGLPQAPALLGLWVAAAFSGLSSLVGASSGPAMAGFARLWLFAITAIVPSLWLVFAFQLTQRQAGLMARQRLLIFGLPLITLGLSLTNQYHQLILPGVPWRLANGAWLWASALLEESLLLVGSLYIHRQLRLQPDSWSCATAIASTAAFVPFVAGIILLTSGTDLVVTLEFTPLFCALSGLALWLATPASTRGSTPLTLAPIQAASPAAAQPNALAEMSHEMRGLLSGIVGASDLLERTQLDRGQQRLLEIVRNSGRSLLDVVNSTLDLAAAEAGKLTPRHEPFDLRACIEDTLGAVAVEAMRKQLHVCYLIEPGVPVRLAGDGKRIAQVLLNLVGNSVKFTEQGGVLVSVGSRALDGDRIELRFRVSDTGPGGIGQSQHYKLFEPFRRFQNQGHPPQPGSGLGLAISQRLVALMGGQLTLERSTAQGTSFAFTVVAAAEDTADPLAQVQPDLQGRRLLILGGDTPGRAAVAAAAERWGLQVANAAGPDEAQARLRDCDVALIVQEGGPAGAALAAQFLRLLGGAGGPPVALLAWMYAAEPEQMGAQGLYQQLLFHPLRHAALLDALRELVGAATAADEQEDAPLAVAPGDALSVLVADDDQLNRDLACQMLQKLGHFADTASGAAEALRRLQECPFDVLLLDMRLGEADGAELARAIRAKLRPEWQPYIIALSGERSSRLADEQRAAGIDAWCQKPLTLKGLAAALHGRRPRQIERAVAEPNHFAKWEAPAYGPPVSDPEPPFSLFQQYGLGPEQARGFVDQFLSDTELLVREMRSSLRDGDTRRIAQAAHKLQSSSAIFSEHRLNRLCTELDALSGSHYFDDYDHYIHLIEAEYQRMRARLEGSRGR